MKKTTYVGNSDFGFIAKMEKNVDNNKKFKFVLNKSICEEDNFVVYDLHSQEFL